MTAWQNTRLGAQVARVVKQLDGGKNNPNSGMSSTIYSGMMPNWPCDPGVVGGHWTRNWKWTRDGREAATAEIFMYCHRAKPGCRVDALVDVRDAAGGRLAEMRTAGVDLNTPELTDMAKARLRQGHERRRCRELGRIAIDV